jgi:hypothetical protein
LTVKTLSPSRPDPNYAGTRRFYEAVGFLPIEEFPTLWGANNPCLFHASATVSPYRGFGADMSRTTFKARILRKQFDLPRYVVVKPEYVGGRTHTFPAEVMLNDAGPLERNIRPWGKGSDVFFFNLTEPQCRKASIDTNDECMVTLIPKG